MEISIIDIKDNNYNAYGFNVYNKNGWSIPKGMISSFIATQYGPSKTNNIIEFSIQSPTGDSSDHLSYTIPCENFEQSKFICDMYLSMVKEYVRMYLIVNTSK